MSQKWVKYPAPGQIRGEGSWYRLEDLKLTEAEWDHYRRTQFLPVYEGDVPPWEVPDDAGL